ncbi:hypothetical protein MSAN_01773100 [Mycena sanguinolenta]|uniref:DUF6534 domain-containing protein n=1 Tax=Mycena sanguinolenta TaxID=230812 RepID=A0A8H6XXS6_9AGAR|nr:hypothetical protein MSAN_01773100 [Mycena sanguinolenta]
MAASQFVASFGVQLAGSWVNMMLYMLEIVMCLRYFQRGTVRPLPHKIGVGAMIFFDTLCTISFDVEVFTTFLLFIGQDSFKAFTTPAALTIFFTYSTAIIEQLFLCHLYFIITRKRVVALFLAFLGLVHTGFSFAAGTMVLATPTNRSVNTITGVGAITCGINDLLIASCLGYELFKLKARTSNSSVVHRVFILSIISGAIVATTTLLMMILYLKGNIAFDFFFSCQGRIYALTLLLNFLSGTSSTSGTTVGSEHQNGLSPMFSKYASPASIRSNISDSSINKELPPLPLTPSLQIATLNLSSQFASASYTSSSAGVMWTPQTPRIAAPYRADSLPH